MDAARRFFLSPQFAVAGASNDRSKFGYKIFAWYHQHSLPVTPLNPRAPEIELPSQTYKTVPSPRDLPNPDQTSLSIVTPPPVTLALLKEAHSVGIPAVWLQPGTYDKSVLDFLDGHFAAAVVGDGGVGGEGWSSPFFLESPIPPQLDLAGAPSQLFQVPPTPSASSALYRSISIPNRKRSRLEVDRRPWLDVDTPSSHVASVISPDDLLLGVEDTSVDQVYRPNRYRKPARSLALDDSVESLSETADIRRKRSRWDPSLIAASPTGHDEKMTISTTTMTATATAAPAVNTPIAYPQPAPVRWSRAVLGVVGKVWDFCWSGAFRGFYAGGGQGYTMTAEDAQPQLASPSIEKESIPTSQRQQGSSSPFSGQFPEDDLKHSWVIVSAREEFMDEASPSQRRRVHRRTPAHTHSRRRSQGKRTLISHAPSMPTKSQFSTPAKPRESPVSVETQRYMAQKRRMEREEDASLARLNRQLQAMIKEGKQALGTRVEVDDLDMED
ncbi:hypothetical protein ASPTUDRAFT_116398 [Aspergillus tubingensis CBS 134.48]|uniref:CoA-binding domain-containing protein n=1 Tax=Aspergillus tubingensis (strain CBS 134.48) TaxID=767770 RepID=A0A1L9NAU3_ASPTC|nr:hypothetical protein ASPTUDRAFT_116398 [Aspergillus tubingensis CBS 134.48]